MEGIIPDPEMGMLSNHYEVIGNIAVVTVPPSLNAYRHDIALAIMSERRNITSVLNKTSKLSGTDRTSRYEVIAGSGTITRHQEFGFSYMLDLTKVFYNTRMASERQRVTLKVVPGERVLVPFCGVGPFVIPIAARGAWVTAVDMNADACRWLSLNVRLNGVAEKVRVCEGDIFTWECLPETLFDRAVVPVPYGLVGVPESLLPWVKPGGYLHLYTFTPREALPGLNRRYARMGLDVELIRRCGNVAPGISRYVFDVRKKEVHLPG